MKPRSVLLISYYFPPLGMAGVQRPLKLAKYLFRLGWKVYVLTVKPIAYWETDSTLLADFPPEIPVFRAGSADPARLTYLLGRKERKDSGRLSGTKRTWDSKLGFVPFASIKAARLVEKFDIAAVWTTSPPPSIHLVGRWLKQNKKVSWLADFRDPWEVEAPEPDSNVWKKRQDKLKRLLQFSDGVTTVNDSLKNYMESFAGVGKVATVFNGFEPGNALPARPSPSKVFTLAYGGTLNASHHPYLFLKALSSWKKEAGHSFRLLLVGRVLGLPLLQWLDELGLAEDAEATGYLAHPEARRRLSEADLFLLFLPPEPKYRLNLPAKIFEYIGLERPTLSVAFAEGAVADFLSAYPVGCLCAGEEAIIEALNSYYQLWKRQGFLSIPEAERRRFGWDKEAQKLSTLLESKLAL